MRFYQVITINILTCLLWACHSTEQKNTTADEKTVQKIDLSLLQGYWISTSYIDSLLKNKSVVKSEQAPLARNTILLQIRQDSITSYGMLFSQQKWKLKQSFENLSIGWRSHKLSYDQDRGIIVARSKEDSTSFSLFRKIKINEKRLVKTKNGRPLFMDLQSNVYAFIIDNLMKGKYKPLFQNSSSNIMVLDSNGIVTGFKNYHKYRIHDYFGTSHPFRPEDAIIFEDTTVVNSGTGPPTNFGVFSWEFNQDTLALTKMFTKNHYSYKKGDKTYRFIKKRP